VNPISSCCRSAGELLTNKWGIAGLLLGK